MSIQMRGAEVAKVMKEKLIREREELNAAGVNPCLTIIRVGAKENDLAYERGAKKENGNDRNRVPHCRTARRYFTGRI